MKRFLLLILILGLATSASADLTLTAGEGIDVTTPGGSLVTVASELATSANLGVATFNTANFTVTAGDVIIKDGGVALAEIASGALSGSDTTLITGTAGSNGHCAQWNADGDLVTAGAACGTGGGGSLVFKNAGSTLISGAGTINVPTAGNLIGAEGATSGTVDLSIRDNPTFASTVTAASFDSGSNGLSTLDSVTINGTFVVDGNTVNLSDTTTNYVLKFNGTSWQPASDATGGGGGGSLTIQEEGSDVLSGFSTLNVIGSAVTITDSSGIATMTISAGSDTNAVKEYYWSASSMDAISLSTTVASLSQDSGTNLDQIVALYDASADECRGVNFKVPSDVTSGSTVTVRWIWYSGTATTGSAVWNFRHSQGDTDGESWDSSTATVAFTDAAKGTVDQIAVASTTVSLATLGWAANDDIQGFFCRDANNGSDNLAGDASLKGASIEIPRN